MLLSAHSGAFNRKKKKNLGTFLSNGHQSNPPSECGASLHQGKT